MNNDFIPDDRHEVDDFFRDALSDYKESPSDAAWNKLNRKLNYKEAADFVTFKKPPVNNSVFPTPVYRMQWFRAIVAGSVAAVFVAATLFIVDRVKNNSDDKQSNLTNSGSVNPETPFYQYNEGNLFVADEPFNEGYHRTWNQQNEAGPVSRPSTSAPEIFKPNVNNTIVAATQTTNQENSTQSVNEQISGRHDDEQSQNMAQLPMNTMNVLNTIQPQHGVMSQVSIPQQDKDPVNRILDAQRVDSIIRAAAIEDSLQQAMYSADPWNSDPTENDGVIKNPNPDQPQSGDNDNKPIFPNSFTPNGDGLNEYFYITNVEKYPDNNLIVQDRNNSVVYKRKGYTGDWNAAGVPDGTYSYLFEYTDENNQKQKIVGVVYIIRTSKK